MRTSDAINELAAALAAAQGEMQNAPMLSENPHFRSKYADLAAIRNATIPALSKHGLSILQTMEMTPTEMLLTTRLLHTSGQWIDSVYPISINERPHVMGSALTYAKRYSWSAMCGIAAEADDDGNEAQDAVKNGPPPKRTREQISAEANRKRQDVRDVEKDVQQIDSLRALDRYAQEVLTPDFMASLGMKQWAVEEYMGKRRRELEYAEEEQQQSGLYQKTTPEQVAKFREMVEWLDGAKDTAELKHRAVNDGYLNGFRLLTRQQQDTLRAHYTMRLESFKAAAAQ